MNNVFLNYGFLNLMIVEFDTEDNIVRTNKIQWRQNLDLNTFQPLFTYGMWRYANDKMWFKSTEKIKSIRLNKFNYKYKVKKVSDYYFEIHCDQFQDYFDGTDNIEIIVKF